MKNAKCKKCSSQTIPLELKKMIGIGFLKIIIILMPFLNSKKKCIKFNFFLKKGGFPVLVAENMQDLAKAT